MFSPPRTARRLLLAGGFALAIAAAPAVAVAVGPGLAVADTCGSQFYPGDPNTMPCGIPSGQSVIGGAPSAGTIIACRGLPGCLSQVVNNPGMVQVPQVDTSVHQSQ
jgi:hypothetical protein